MTPQARKHALQAAEFFNLLTVTPSAAPMAAYHAAVALGVDPPEEYQDEIDELLASIAAFDQAAFDQQRRSEAMDRP